MDLQPVARPRLPRKGAFRELGKQLSLYWSALRGLPLPDNIRDGSVLDDHIVEKSRLKGKGPPHQA